MSTQLIVALHNILSMQLIAALHNILSMQLTAALHTIFWHDKTSTNVCGHKSSFGSVFLCHVHVSNKINTVNSNVRDVSRHGLQRHSLDVRLRFILLCVWLVYVFCEVRKACMDLPDFGTILYTYYRISDFRASTRLKFLHRPGTNLNLSTHVYSSSELS
jgi:hypothetical protein